MFVSSIYTLKSFDWVRNQQQKNCIIVPPRHTLSYEAVTDTKVVLLGSTYLRISTNPGPQIILRKWPEVSDRRHSVYCMHHESGEPALSVCVRVWSSGSQVEEGYVPEEVVGCHCESQQIVSWLHCTDSANNGFDSHYKRGGWGWRKAPSNITLSSLTLLQNYLE